MQYFFRRIERIHAVGTMWTEDFTPTIIISCHWHANISELGLIRTTATSDKIVHIEASN